MKNYNEIQEIRTKMNSDLELDVAGIKVKKINELKKNIMDAENHLVDAEATLTSATVNIGEDAFNASKEFDSATKQLEYLNELMVTLYGNDK